MAAKAAASTSAEKDEAQSDTQGASHHPPVASCGNHDVLLLSLGHVAPEVMTASRHVRL